MSVAPELDFTVIVPSYERPESLRRCLDALAAQEYPHDRFEVLVVDDGSALPPRALVDEMRAKLTVELMAVMHGGPAAARNRAVARALGRFLAFTDDDCRPDLAWLRQLRVALDRQPDALVGGRVSNALVENRYSSASQMVTDLVYAHYNERADEARFFASNNIAIAAASFRSIGGFDEGFVVLACEDREFCDRWRAAGGRMVYAADAVVNHAHLLDLGGFVRQHFTYGRGAMHFHRIRAERGSGSLRGEMSFHLDVRNWFMRPIQEGSVGGAAKTAALMALWQSANLAGYLYEWIVRTGYRRASPIP